MSAVCPGDARPTVKGHSHYANTALAFHRYHAGQCPPEGIAHLSQDVVPTAVEGI